MSREIDLDKIIDDGTNKSGEYMLWLAVSLDAVNSYKMYSSKLAESFIFDSDNFFFDIVAGELGYSSEVWRERINAALKR